MYAQGLVERVKILLELTTKINNVRTIISIKLLKASNNINY
jgi:hypothetical protein